MADLAFFVGNWAIDGEGVDFTGKPFKISAHYLVAFDLDGAWLSASGEILGAKLREYWGYDARKHEFLRIQFQSNGTFTVLHSTGCRKDTLLWDGEGHAPNGELFVLRSNQVREDADSMLVTWERHTGTSWKVYSTERLRRIAG